MAAATPLSAIVSARSLGSARPASAVNRPGLRVPHAPLRTLLPELPRGGITEILGSPSSGRTALAHSLVAAATRAGEATAAVDFDAAFDPVSAQAAGADLDKLLWVRAGARVDWTMRATDLLLQGGGFGLVWLDLCGVPRKLLQHVPTSYWYRFRRALENTPAILLITAFEPQARSCALRQIDLGRRQAKWEGAPGFRRFTGLAIEVHLRKPFAPQAVELHAGAA